MNTEVLSTIRSYLEKQEQELLREFLDQFNVHDIADLIDDLNPIEQKKVIDALPREMAADILPELDDYEEIAKSIDNLLLTDLLQLMDDDDATDILQDLSPKRREKILKLMEKGEEEQIRILLSYGEETAGGIMTMSYLSVLQTVSVKRAIEVIKAAFHEIEVFHYLYAIDIEGRLVGVVSLRELLLSDDGVLIRDIMEDDVISVNVHTDQEEAAQTASKYDLLAIPVVDDEDKIIGVITIDDIIDVLEEETTEDIYAMAGSSADETETDSVVKIAALRFPWLFTNLFGGLLAATIISFYKITLAKALSLSFFIPVITGMGGNAGLQTTTHVIRGLSTGDIELDDLGFIFFKEIRIGAMVGILCGTLVGFVSYLWQGTPVLGVVVGVSMFCAISIAASVGVIAPFTFKRMNIDPAIAAGPFVTTSNDIMGIVIYLSIASYILEVVS